MSEHKHEFVQEFSGRYYSCVCGTALDISRLYNRWQDALEREKSLNDRVRAYEKMLANYDKLTFLIGNPFIWEGLKLLLEKEPMRLGPAMTRNALETYEEFYKEWNEIDTYEWDMAKPTKAAPNEEPK